MWVSGAVAISTAAQALSRFIRIYSAAISILNNKEASTKTAVCLDLKQK
jgi:hypothetical protein